MIQELYRVLNFLVILFLGLFVSSFQSVLLKIPVFSWLELDLILLIIVYLSLHRQFFETAALVLLLGRIAEIHSSAPVGILTASYLAAHMAILLTREMVLVATTFSSIILCVACGLIWKIMFLFLSQRYGIFDNAWKSSLEYSLPYLLSLGIFARPIFDLMRKIDHITRVERDSEAREMTGEEF
jgi:hypothetical protein